MKRPTIDQATKAEIQKLVAALPPPSKSRFSPLIFKVAAGYAAMAVFTITALALATFNLSLLNDTTRQVANVELPAANALINLRISLLAQERYAGNYAILRDPAFVELFRQRRKISLANLAILESSGASGDIAALKRLYLDYQEASEHLFAGKSGNRKELQSAALRVLDSLDALYIERQHKVQEVLALAEERMRASVRSTIVISCAGFLLAAWVAPYVIYRLFAALKKLQQETHRIASGDLNYQPHLPAVDEISELATDFNEMAAKIKEMEQKNIDALPLSRLPGNAAIERVLDERLHSGAPFAFCTVTVRGLRSFTAHYGYAKTSELLSATGALIFAAVRECGATTDFAGHVGGAEFVMVLAEESAGQVCRAVEDSFGVEMARYRTAEYNLVAPERPLDISVLHCAGSRYASALEVARAAAQPAGSGNEEESASTSNV